MIARVITHQYHYIFYRNFKNKLCGCISPDYRISDNDFIILFIYEMEKLFINAILNQFIEKGD